MDGYGIAKSGLANGQLIARTDGRTNGRTTHLEEITQVPKRARENRVLSSDLAFQDFLQRTTLKPRSEVVVWSRERLINHLYDEETERLRPIARALGATPKRARAKVQQFTDRQVQIALESLRRQEERSK
jgi:hypothetical protein